MVWFVSGCEVRGCWQSREAALCLPAADSEGFISTGSSVVSQEGKEIEKEKLPLSFFLFFFPQLSHPLFGFSACQLLFQLKLRWLGLAVLPMHRDHKCGERLLGALGVSFAVPGVVLQESDTAKNLAQIHT